MTSNVVRSGSFVKDSATEAQRTCTVLLPCPQSFTGDCTYRVHTWSCDYCKLTMRFGYDKFFYCACGRAPTSSFTFRCSCPRHGDEFHEFPERDLTYLLARMHALREINILVLGETGVGKSTWINGVTNYMTFGCFEDAEKTSPACLIPSVHHVMVDGQTRDVVVGDAKELEELGQQEAGESVTQFPASFVFKYRDFAVRLIDTPGIGDTRGLDVDKMNLQNVLDHLANFDELHGICVLLPPNQSRLTVSFKFCLNELLKQLHRDACKNIVFCFTRSRCTDYSPGETVDLLQKLFKESIDADIELTTKTLYCMDNETIVYLFGLRQGVDFSAAIRETRRASWETSVNETGRLLEYVTQLEPHKMKDTLSLNATRRVILALCNGPLVDIAADIRINIRKMEVQEVDLKMASTAAIAPEDLQISTEETRLKPLKRPRVVCTSAACESAMRVVMRGGVEKYEYDQVCCSECRAPHIRLCERFVGKIFGGKCRACSCEIKHHRLMTFDVVRQHSVKRDPETDRRVAAARSPTERRGVVVGRLVELKTAQQQEQTLILEAAAKLIKFLGDNSVVAPSSDAFVEYLSQLIKLDKKAQGASASVDSLRDVLTEYEAVKQRVYASHGPQWTMTTDEVQTLIRNLFKLQLNGQKLKAAVDVAENSTAELAKQGDRTFYPDLQRTTPGKRNAVQSVMVKAAAGMRDARSQMIIQPKPIKPKRVGAADCVEAE